MRAVVAGLVGLALCAGPLAAQAPSECSSGDTAIGAVFPVPFAAKAIATTRKLNVLVVGAGSSTLPGPEGARFAYPARLKAALEKRLPGTAVSVTTDVIRRRTAADMVRAIEPALTAAEASLVIWQTGTTDAMRSIDPEVFGAALERGIDIARSAGSDVVLMNMQYSPRTELMVAVGHYAEALRWVALQRGVSLFDRFALMKSWSELGVFKLRGSANKLDTARRVHDCIGRLLAELVVEAAGQSGEAIKAK